MRLTREKWHDLWYNSGLIPGQEDCMLPATWTAGGQFTCIQVVGEDFPRLFGLNITRPGYNICYFYLPFITF